MMARATGLEPAASGVTGRDKHNVIKPHGYLPRTLTRAKKGQSIRPSFRESPPTETVRPVPPGRGPHAQFLFSLRQVNRAVGETAHAQPRDARRASTGIGSANASGKSLNFKGSCDALVLLNSMH